MKKYNYNEENNLASPRKKESLIHKGMPELEKTDTPLSFFEFWPGVIIYIPVAFQWLMLAIRYRSLTVPLVANPLIPLGGMVGESKSTVFMQASGEARNKIAPWIVFTVTESKELTLNIASQLMTDKKLKFPVVAKPDIGCRGAGIRIIRDTQELSSYINHYPCGNDIILQKLIPYEAEAGIFYIRDPHKTKGELFSITLKYSPYVIGNGVNTLDQLIDKDERASHLADLYKSRHKDRLEDILPEGQAFRLAFSGSHCRGSIFRDGRKYITTELTDAINQVCMGLPEFYYGRIDIRFSDIESLMNGKQFYILEINGASSEAAHIWDSRSSLRELYRVLFYQYRTLFRLGAINRQRGFQTPSFIQLVKAWIKEKTLIRHYPETE